jgi:hypothetical protein
MKKPMTINHVIIYGSSHAACSAGDVHVWIKQQQQEAEAERGTFWHLAQHFS